MASIESVFHPVINVSDMDQAIGFFGGVLGLKQTFDDVHDPVAIGALFGFDQPVVRAATFECADRSEFEITCYDRPKGRQTFDTEMNDVGMVALALRVTEVEVLVARVEAAGYRLLSGIVQQVLPDGAILKVAVCIGPDRLKIILVEPPTGRKGLSG